MGTHFLLYGHGGSYNHGAEAITRSTIALLRRLSPGCTVTLSSHFVEQDIEFALPADEIVGRSMAGKTTAEVYAPAIERITPGTVCLHVGGDNYCYPNWQKWADIHYTALAKGAYSVLWSCSVDPEKLDDEMLAALKTHHLITAREGITYRALLTHGCTNVIKVRDIAFALESEAIDFPLKDYVVINLSPLVIRRQPLVLKAYQVLLDGILDTTSFNIALLPHVIQPADHDAEALRQLDCHGSERAVLVSDKLSAAQLKYVISRAHCCVTARTHAAIAAYSSGVPVLAVGYSSKAAGIAAEAGCPDRVIDLCSLVDGHEIWDAFKAMMSS